MRQIARASVVLAIAVAAMRFAGGGAGQNASAGSEARSSNRIKSGRSVQTQPLLVGTYQGGCSAFDPEDPAATYPRDANQGLAKSVIDHFFGLKDQDREEPHKEGPHNRIQGKPEAQSSQHGTLKDKTGVRFVVALAPDPRHTNLSLLFDREMVAIQQAAQDEGYNFNSSWLPWTIDSSSFSYIADEQRSEDLSEERESCPGVLLFRKSVGESSASGSESGYSYDNALVVLIVGEQPTGGLNESQWSNAMAFLHRNASVMEAAPPPPDGDTKTAPPVERKLNLLGPTFTGSLASLERDLFRIKSVPSTARIAGRANENGNATESVFPSQGTSIQILGGSVRGCTAIRWFQKKLHEEFGSSASFGSLEENDSVQIYNFLNYLNHQGTKISDVAILSEDETAYANNLVSPATLSVTAASPNVESGGSCDFPYELASRPVRLSYPRDISALRSAYEKQSVFAGSARSGHSVLDDGAELGGEPPDASDTIRTFGGAVTPVNQEAILYGIVSNLRSHHSRYLLLRCTNPLDFLFLTRFFHRAYPEGRIVTVGSDLLFRREIDTTEFRGVLALSSYSLLPRDQHWSHLSQDGPDALPAPHTHRIPESDQEAAYLAARYLFDRRATQAMPRPLSGTDEPLLILPFKENLPDFADPFWLHRPGDQLTRIQAPTWLSVVGRDGYWPIAVLNPETTPNQCLDHNPDRKLDQNTRDAAQVCPPHPPSGSSPPSTMVRIDGTSPSRPGGQGAHYDLDQADRGRFNESILFKMDRPWELCAICACLLLFYQVYGVARGSKHTSFGLFALFRGISTPSHRILLGIHCALALVLLSILLTIGLAVPHYGRMLSQGMRLSVFGTFWALAHFAFFILLMRPKKTGGSFARWAFGILTVIADLSITAAFFLGLDSARIMPLIYRMGHLTEGVSPLAPPLFLIAGFYLWIWQALAGNSMLCCGRPLLPELQKQDFPTGDEPIYRYWETRWYYKMLGLPTLLSTPPPSGVLSAPRYRISDEMGKRIIKVAAPLCLDPKVILLPACLFGAAVLYAMLYGIPLLSLEGLHYDQVINCLLLLAFVLTIAEAARLFMTWKELQRLLASLSRLRLRRTFAKLHAIDTGSLWSVSGSVQRVQYHFFAQQLDAVKRLCNLPGGDLPSVVKACRYGTHFAETSADKIGTGAVWEDSLRPQDKPPVYIRQVFNDAVADVLNKLFKHWESETTSLSLESVDSKSQDKQDEGERAVLEMELAEELIVRTQEEFVCFHYIAFIQNILARMRTMILSMIFLFVSVCFSISFYPFVPRTGISMWMLVNLALIASAVVYVYAGMERDTTLSYMTNTRPGSLGAEFYIKTATFLAGPVIGLLTTQFPAISESFLSVLQPGLDALK